MTPLPCIRYLRYRRDKIFKEEVQAGLNKLKSQNYYLSAINDWTWFQEDQTYLQHTQNLHNAQALTVGTVLEFDKEKVNQCSELVLSYAKIFYNGMCHI